MCELLLLLLLLLLFVFVCCLCLPPHGVVRFLCWHVLKLEFWHFAHPELILIAYVEDNNGDDDTYGNNNDNVAPCCPCCYVTFKIPPIQKHSYFLGFLDKNFVTDPQNQQT